MTYIVNRKVTIKWKLNIEIFAVVNKEVLSSVSRKFGSTTKAVKTMLAKEQLLRTLMPSILGRGSNDLDWHKNVADYWHSLSLDIPEVGLPLNLSLVFDLDDKDRKENITNLLKAKNVKSNITEKEFADLVLADKSIREEDYYKYCSFEEPEHYLLYIYSFEYRDVANSPEDAALRSSPFIRFYMHDEEVAKRNNQAEIDIAIKASNAFLELIKDTNADEKILNVLCVLEPSNIELIQSLGTKERQMRLFDTQRNKSREFLNIVDDKTLHTKALLEKLITKGIVKMLSGTEVIVDSQDTTIIIGNSRLDAVTWFSNELNAQKLNEYTTRLKQ